MLEINIYIKIIITMSEYNDRWTREKFIEYRKLKKEGYTDKMLREHFGEDIYYSGMYNKNGSSLPVILKFGNFINEIKITPENMKRDIGI
jgi:hypothetical protein